MFKALTDFGVTKRAVDKNILNIEFWNPRDFTSDSHSSVDDRPYGGGPGMVMKIEPLRAAIISARAKVAPNEVKVIGLSPQGKKIAQSDICELSRKEHIIFVSGRYEGIDERLYTLEVDEEWSVGDYVLSGGELAAMVIMDATARMLPGVLGHDLSAQQDSFMRGLLDYPHYTRPQEIEGLKVPEVLLSGNHSEISKWRRCQQIRRTSLRRPDLLVASNLDEQEGLVK